MYRHLKEAEKLLSPSHKEGTQIPFQRGGYPRPYRVVGFTVFYAGNVKKLISMIVYNVEKYGVLIPDRFNYIVRPSDFVFHDEHNSIIWSVELQRTKMVRYLNFKAEFQCTM